MFEILGEEHRPSTEDLLGVRSRSEQFSGPPPPAGLRCGRVRWPGKDLQLQGWEGQVVARYETFTAVSNTLI